MKHSHSRHDSDFSKGSPCKSLAGQIKSLSKPHDRRSCAPGGCQVQGGVGVGEPDAHLALVAAAALLCVLALGVMPAHRQRVVAAARNLRMTPCWNCAHILRMLLQEPHQRDLHGSLQKPHTSSEQGNKQVCAEILSSGITFTSKMPKQQPCRPAPVAATKQAHHVLPCQFYSLRCILGRDFSAPAALGAPANLPLAAGRRCLRGRPSPADPPAPGPMRRLCRPALPPAPTIIPQSVMACQNFSQSTFFPFRPFWPLACTRAPLRDVCERGGRPASPTLQTTEKILPHCRPVSHVTQLIPHMSLR